MNKLIAFICGIFVGGAIVIAIGLVLTRSDLDYPKHFGDITIYPLKADNKKMLVLRRENKTFFYGEMDEVGKLATVAIIDHNDLVRFSLTVSKQDGKWKNAMYSCGKNEYLVGEKYTDINFDGQFDVKNVFDDAGKLINSFIYIGKIWQKVDKVNALQGIAVSDHKAYIYDNNAGWKLK